MAKLYQGLSDIGTKPFVTGGVRDDSAAFAAEKIGGIIEGGLKGWEDARLEGQELTIEQEQTIAEQGLAEVTTSPYGEVKVAPDTELNLNKIAAARRQGKLSAEQAKILVQGAVKQASNRMPGRASEYRRQAAEFFGDFAPGQDLLDPTAAEKAAAKQAEYEAKKLYEYQLNIGMSPMDIEAVRSGSPQAVNKFRQLDMLHQTAERAKTQNEIAKANNSMSTIQANTNFPTIANGIAISLPNRLYGVLSSTFGRQFSSEQDLLNLSADEKAKAKFALEQLALNERAAVQDPMVGVEVFNNSWETVTAQVATLSKLIDDGNLEYYKKSNDLQMELMRTGVLATPEGRQALAAAAWGGPNIFNMPSMAKITESLPKVFGDTVIKILPPTRFAGAVDYAMTTDPSGQVLTAATDYVAKSFDAWKDNKNTMPPEVVAGMGQQMANLTNEPEKQNYKAMDNLISRMADPDFIEFSKQPAMQEELTKMRRYAENYFGRTINQISTSVQQEFQRGAGNYITMKIDDISGQVVFEMLPGLPETAIEDAKSYMNNFNNTYAKRINNTVKSIAHFSGNKEYASAAIHLMQSGGFNELPAQLLSEIEYMSTLDKVFSSKKIPGWSETILEGNPELRKMLTEGSPELRKALKNIYKEGVGSFKDTFFKLADALRLEKPEPKPLPETVEEAGITTKDVKGIVDNAAMSQTPLGLAPYPPPTIEPKLGFNDKTAVMEYLDKNGDDITTISEILTDGRISNDPAMMKKVLKWISDYQDLQ